MELPKKRGPKSKKIKPINADEILTENPNSQQTSDIVTQIFNNATSLFGNEAQLLGKDASVGSEKNLELNSFSIGEVPEKIHKKRGRKPKGGKIVNAQEVVSLNNANNDNKDATTNKLTKPNIILHLKCFLSDLDNNSGFNPSSFNFSKDKLIYETIGDDVLLNQNITTPLNDNNTYHNIINKSSDEYESDDSVDVKNGGDLNKEIHKKLKQLEISLHLNNNVDKKSACFWCTFDFDNPAIYIPKSYMFGKYNVYGCFCSPECSCAYLMNESIDNASKFERYYLLNHIYTKIYKYEKNIKPAPNPYYTLNKYYGNLTIQEYRSLLQNERLFLVVDKPLTRIMPELIEDNDEYILNKKVIPFNLSVSSSSENTSYKVKKKIQKKIKTKNNIINEKFGIS
jgi:hypothetical protein